MTHSFVNCVSGIFLSEQMVGEPMQSTEVYDFFGHTGELDMQGMDRTDLCRIG